MPELRRSKRVAAQVKPEEEPTVSAPAVKKQKSAAPPPKKEAPAAKPKVEELVGAKTPELNVGDKIPDWVFLDQDSKDIHLAKLDKPIVVIFSYPRASTPGCTRQACGFRDNYNALSSNDAIIFGLSADSPAAQKKFATKHGFQYRLISDPTKKLIAALGAKKSDGKIARSHWIFVYGVLKIKKIGISPEVSYTTAKEDIEKLAKK